MQCLMYCSATNNHLSAKSLKSSKKAMTAHYLYCICYSRSHIHYLTTFYNRIGNTREKLLHWLLFSFWGKTIILFTLMQYFYKYNRVCDKVISPLVQCIKWPVLGISLVIFGFSVFVSWSFTCCPPREIPAPGNNNSVLLSWNTVSLLSVTWEADSWHEPHLSVLSL